jgi:hypothetical protein
MIIPANS